jgi:HEAT repeat protein
MRLVVMALGLLCLAGCGQPRPTLAGGKPVAHWLRAVDDPDPRVRKEAVFKLGNVGPTEAEALPAVTKALKDPDAAVRREAILALMKFGADAKTAETALTELQHDRDSQVRSYAAKALQKLQS